MDGTGFPLNTTLEGSPPAVGARRRVRVGGSEEAGAAGVLVISLQLVDLVVLKQLQTCTGLTRESNQQPSDL